MKNIRFYIFGDSICFGQHVDLHKVWAVKLSKYVNKELAKIDKHIVFNNLSINGNTTRMALERMPYDIQSNKPDYLLIQFGMNDANYWLSDNGVPRVGKHAFKSNLEEMIDRANAIGVKKIFLNTNHISTLTGIMKNTNISYQKSVMDYNKIIREVSNYSSNIILTDIENVFSKYSEKELEKYILEDGVHLSELGHDVYFNELFPQIEKEITGDNYK